MYSSILVPVDLSHPEHIDTMLDKATSLLSKGGTLTMLHVVPLIPAYVASELPRDIAEGGVSRARDTIADRLTARNIEADVKVVSGDKAASVALRIAEDLGVELIVIASHNPDLSDYFLGSTAARIVRHAQCSVLVMR